MTPWLVAVFGLMPPLTVAVATCAKGSPSRRLAAAQVASPLAVFLLAAMTFAFEQASSIDLALALALLSIPASLLFAVFLERWL